MPAGEMFKEAGMEPDMKVMASSSKTLSFRKPATSSKPNSSPTPHNGIAVKESFDESIAAEHSAAEIGIVPAS